MFYLFPPHLQLNVSGNILTSVSLKSGGYLPGILSVDFRTNFLEFSIVFVSYQPFYCEFEMLFSGRKRGHAIQAES